MNIKEIILRDLLDLEKASSVICKNYENSLKRYDGSINTSVSEYNEFNKYNKIRNEIIKEIQKRLQEIEI